MTSPVMRKHAHDSGDGETIYHCPFCGSGQVIARSDRTIECQFCHICFTVQVQPQYPAFPQTINGQPVQVPGMPGEIGQGPMPPGGDPGQDPNADPNAPVDPSQMDDQGNVPPADDPTASDDDSGGEDQDSAPPWVKKSSRTFVTDRGHVLGARDYARHLAIKHAPDPRAMAAQIKEEREHE